MAHIYIILLILHLSVLDLGDLVCLFGITHWNPPALPRSSLFWVMLWTLEDTAGLNGHPDDKYDTKAFEKQFG